ncbi:hypothetical protein FRC11_007591 [Ceratobasidium sp. 423]|nr:hypothetical protein FRC11_007591 [Ceratobasidium sp. 423]
MGRVRRVTGYSPGLATRPILRIVAFVIVLPLAFPAYESVIQAWLDLTSKIPDLVTAIEAGIAKIQEYINRTIDARLNTLAMVINPGLRFEWINRCWATYDRDRAYGTVQKTLHFTTYTGSRVYIPTALPNRNGPVPGPSILSIIRTRLLVYKMACTVERNRLSVRTMGAFQVLKHALKHYRREFSEETLDLVSHLLGTLELDD